jgi:methyltransferase (TIGR00027 family)
VSDKRRDRASRTALGSAYLRAAHLRDDPPPWILEDHVAARLLSPQDIAELEAPLADWDPRVRAGFRVAHAVRSRLAEDVAVAGLAAGRVDYAILGAGIDTFAWRHPRASEFTVWEYDLPGTQAWKREALRGAGLGVPDNVRSVAVDLVQVPLETLDMPARATWSWMGVTMYLAKDVTARVLRTIAQGGDGTTLVVNFVLAPDERDDLGRAAQWSAGPVVASVGEPVVAAYRRAEVDGVLRAAGFGTVELLDATDLTRRYLGGRTDLRLPGSTVLAIASV